MRFRASVIASAALVFLFSAEAWHVVRPPGGGCLPPACRDGQWPMATPVLVHGDRFVMIGDGADPQRIYESSAGARWRAMPTNAAWGTRYKSADASFAGALWRAGGFEPRGEQRVYFNDVWRSSDGTRWQRVIAAAPWSPRASAHLSAADSTRRQWAPSDGVGTLRISDARDQFKRRGLRPRAFFCARILRPALWPTAEGEGTVRHTQCSRLLPHEPGIL